MNPSSPSGAVGPPLLRSDDIVDRVSALAAQIDSDYAGRDLRLVTVLKGGLFFLADLCRRVQVDVKLDFMAVSSYGPGSTGSVRITKDLDDSIAGADVLVIEDIIDTGLTLNYILKMLRARGPASLEVCTLLDKDVRRIVDIPVRYTGFGVPDRFLVGYGLDYRGHYRNLREIYTMDEEYLRTIAG
ncbi:MAG: hypoxanthine phosphoribosyltransferase [Coriobacteriia bacterium]|nr:hypoxanthine phosphoribosyltransferase [Coriobacteriia bacterium]